MKLVKIRTADAGLCIGIEHQAGRVERVAVAVSDDIAPLIDRLVHSFNACDELSDATLQIMATGGTRFGSLAERIAMVALLWGDNGRLAERLLEQARKEIRKTNGKL